MFFKKKDYASDYQEVLDFSKTAYEMYDYENDNFLISDTIIENGYKSLCLCYLNKHDEEFNGWVFVTAEEIKKKKIDLQKTYVVSKEEVFKIFPVAFALILTKKDNDQTLYKFAVNKDGIYGFINPKNNRQATYTELTNHTINK